MNRKRKASADMAPTSTNLFKVEEANGVLTVTFSSGEPLNYLTIAALTELDQLVTEWAANPHYRAIVIQSDPDEVGFITHFSAEELYDLIKAPETSRYSAIAVRQFKSLLDKFAALPQVVIAALNGDTMGGGLELALACDIRIGQSGDYRYGNPEVRLGILPGAGATQRLGRLIGMGKAVEFVLRGRVVSPDVALSLGIVNEVVSDAPARAHEIAAEIAQFPPLGVANAKRALYLGNDGSIQNGFEIEGLAWLHAMQSDDARTALKEFLAVPLEKRRDWLESGPYPAYLGM
jgi:enoyl-CoA hydratase/carnithine racemase